MQHVDQSSRHCAAESQLCDRDNGVRAGWIFAAIFDMCRRHPLPGAA